MHAQGAVEFLLLAGQMDQAFDIAQGHNEMDTFARIVSLSAQPSDYTRIAQYYESRGEFEKVCDGARGLMEQRLRLPLLLLACTIDLLCPA